MYNSAARFRAHCLGSDQQCIIAHKNRKRSMTKLAVPAEAPTLRTPPARAPRTSVEAATGRKSETQPGSLAWPLAWFNEATWEAWRAWSPLSRLAPHEDLHQREKRHPANIQDSVDPPTSIDRLFHASVGRFTFGLSPASLW